MKKIRLLFLWVLISIFLFPAFSMTVYAKPAGHILSDVDLEIEKAQKAYNKTSGKKRKIIVGVIDTGVNYTHPDLKDHLWKNPGEIPDDGIDNDKNGYIDDVYGWDFCNDAPLKPGTYFGEDNNIHGTHCAGIIAASPSKELGTSGGVASGVDVEIMILKALSCTSNSTQGKGTVRDAIEAIHYATSMGADVCNLSWATTVYSEPLKQALKESDILFITGAGNNNSNNNSSSIYPASFLLDNVISVASVDSSGVLASTSNYGHTSVDLAAPGVQILSTAGDGYRKMNGTSMAAPHVAGVASILYTFNDFLYASNVKEIITNTITPLDTLNGRLKYPGVVNAYQAVLAANNLERDTLKPTLEIKKKAGENSLTLQVDAHDTGGSQIRVVKYMPGSKKISNFARGTKGTSLTKNTVVLPVAGLYTFYTSDYAGNESILRYWVTTDSTPPVIKSSYSISDDYKTKTVSVQITDKGTGVKTVKYLKGNKTAADFKTSGTKIPFKNGTGSFTATSIGNYTIYAADCEGNVSIQVITVKIIKARQIQLTTQKKTLKINQTFRLTPTLLPASSTDQLKYHSLNKRVATVSSSGKITALKTGTAAIVVTASSKKTALFMVTVTK